MFSQKKAPKRTQALLSSSSDDEEIEIHYDDESDCDELNENVEAAVDDFVIVLVSGKSRSLKYIARIDDFDGNEYEGVFLQKVNSRILPGEDAEAPT